VVAWSNSLGEDFALAGGAMAFRYVKRLEQGPPPVGVVANGQPELRPPAVANAISEYWRTILQEPDNVDWEEVRRQWAEPLWTLRRDEVELPPLTGPDLAAAVRSMWTGVSEGPDGLTRGDAIRLPPAAWDALATVLEACETQGWPEALTSGRAVSLPKSPDGPLVVAPSALRPITVLALVVRAWGKARCVHLRPWVAGWADSRQSGPLVTPGRKPGRGTMPWASKRPGRPTSCGSG